MIKQRTRILLCLDDRLHMNQIATGIERETQFPREGVAFQPIKLDEASPTDTANRCRLEF